MIIQFCGLSGSGKTTLAKSVQEYFSTKNVAIEVIDGDEYRKFLCSDLGFTKQDRNTNIRRLAFIAAKLSKHKVIPIISAINPYEEVREEVRRVYQDVKTIYIKCSLEKLIDRDVKGLYSRALLPPDHPDKINNLSGVNDPFEIPTNADLIIETDKQTISESIRKLIAFIEKNRF